VRALLEKPMALKPPKKSTVFDGTRIFIPMTNYLLVLVLFVLVLLVLVLVLVLLLLLRNKTFIRNLQCGEYVK